MSATTTATTAETPGARVREAVAWLTPGYFALVMASGIISVGLSLEGFATLSRVLLGVTVLAYAVLVVLFAWRIARYRHTVREDFADPARAFGFFTFGPAAAIFACLLASLTSPWRSFLIFCRFRLAFSDDEWLMPASG